MITKRMQNAPNPNLELVVTTIVERDSESQIFENHQQPSPAGTDVDAPWGEKRKTKWERAKNYPQPNEDSGGEFKSRTNWACT